MKTLKYFVVLFLLLNLFTACTNDSDEDLYSIDEVATGDDGKTIEDDKG